MKKALGIGLVAVLAMATIWMTGCGQESAPSGEGSAAGSAQSSQTESTPGTTAEATATAATAATNAIATATAAANDNMATQTEEGNTETMSGSNEEWPDEAPDQFHVRMELSNGTVVMELNKAWAPIGVQRFYDLVKQGVFEEMRIFRVVPGFIVQWGISGDPAVSAQWRNNQIQDDPVRQTNARGTITFATAGPNTRTSQMFINLGNNAGLDRQGFAPIGRVIEGMNVVDEINGQYGERPDQGQIQQRGNEYLNQYFPNLDYIKSMTLEPAGE